MKRQLCYIFFALLQTSFISAQNRNKGDLFIGVSAGVSFANFLNSTPPHKLNLFNYDAYYIPSVSANISVNPTYVDYQTNLIKDLLVKVTAGADIEYFIKNNMSIYSGLYFEPKGINLNYSNITQTSVDTTIVTYKTKLSVNYLTIPIVLRKYFFREKKFFFECGIYIGYLVSSSFKHSQSRVFESQYLTDRYSSNYNWNNLSPYTNKIDYGLILGAGYSKKISEKLFLTAETKINFGLRKLDSKFNNEFSVIPIPNGVNFANYLIRSTNYQGFNSNSININLAVQVSLGYKI